MTQRSFILPVNRLKREGLPREASAAQGVCSHGIKLRSSLFDTERHQLTLSVPEYHMAEIKYSSYTYDHPNVLVRYPHRVRNDLVTKEIGHVAPDSWLDFGAGDGALQRLMAQRGNLPPQVDCFEPVESMRADLINNFAALKPFVAGDLQVFSSLESLGDRTYSLVTALEVLEHLPLPERIKFYAFLGGQLKTGGECLIEVPVEYGVILAIKECGRKFLKKRVSDYTLTELIRAVVFGHVADTNRRYDWNDQRTFISPHHGFDLFRLFSELSTLGRCEEVFRTPFRLLPRQLNQSVLLRFVPQIRDESSIVRALEQGVVRATGNPPIFNICQKWD